MVNAHIRQQTDSITGAGSYMHNLSPKIVEEIERLGTADTLITVGGPEHNRASLASTPPPALRRALWLGLAPGDVREATGFLGDRQYAQQRRPSRLEMDQLINDR